MQWRSMPIAEVDASLDGVDLQNVDLLSTLGTAMDTAAQRLTDIADSDPALRGTGTTLVALLLDGTRVGVGSHRRLPRLPAARR